MFNKVGFSDLIKFYNNFKKNETIPKYFKLVDDIRIFC